MITFNLKMDTFMIEIPFVAHIVTAFFRPVLYLRRKFCKGLLNEPSGVDRKPADTLGEYNGGVCFIDANGCIGTVVSRKKRSNLQNESGNYIPEFLRR